jgi:hypothetical protein
MMPKAFFNTTIKVQRRVKLMPGNNQWLKFKILAGGDQFSHDTQ